MSTDTKVLENVKAEEVARQMLDGELPVAEDEPGMIHIGGVKVRADVWDALMESIKQVKPLEPNNTYAYRAERLGWFDYAPEPDGVTQFGAVGYTRGYCSPGRGFEYTGFGGGRGRFFSEWDAANGYTLRSPMLYEYEWIDRPGIEQTYRPITTNAPFKDLDKIQTEVKANATA